MDDSKKKPDPDSQESTLQLKAPRRIVLKKTVDEGSIKQSFAHGRTKSVAVEVRRKRTFVKADEGRPPEPSAFKPPTATGSPPSREGAEGGERRGTPHILKPMSAEEQKAYLQEQERQRQEEEQRRREAEEARAREAAARRAEEEALARARVEEEARAAAEAEKQGREQAEKAPSPLPTEEQPAAPATDKDRKEPPKEAKGKGKGEEEEEIKKKKGKEGHPAPEPAAEGAEPSTPATIEPAAAGPAVEEMVLEEDRKDHPKKKLSRAQREDVARQKSENLVAQRLAQVEELRRMKQERQRVLMETEAQESSPPSSDEPQRGGGGRGRGRGGEGAAQEKGGRGSPRRGKPGRGRQQERRVETAPAPGPVVREVVVPEMITVGDLANRMAVKSSEVIKLLFKQGMMVTINHSLDQDTAVLVVEELGHTAKPVSEAAAIEAEMAVETDAAQDLVLRPPVVTVMGHVDHGKTSLLDAIRKTDVTSSEFGGITQHIGAYQVKMKGGQRITFLDTPGHAAFTAMRARGAKATDIVVLVVAADDGVMPQTVEAINHARAAGVPIVVAVNKIDKPQANPEQVMRQLTEHDLVAEEWGGTTIFVPVSAKTNVGLEQLEEMILLQAEVLDLKANPAKKAHGVIIEAKLDKGRGPVATCLVQSGTLNTGDVVVAGSEWGKVRTLFSDKGEQVESASPAMPVEIIGLSGVPSAGDDMAVVPDERRAREIALFRQRRAKEQQQAAQLPTKLGDLFDQIQQGEVQELKVVLKGDVQGSVEAVADALAKIVHPRVRVAVVHQGVGGITESDVSLAQASNGLVLGFNVRSDLKARILAEREGVEIRFYNIIYDLVEDIRKALEGMLRPTMEEKVLGRAEVREVFRIAKVGQVAGCRVLEGHILRSARVRLLRDNVVTFEGAMHSLKHFKEDVKEVKEGNECGVGLERFNDLKTGDILEFFVQEEVRQTL